jgi:hypothetical protein
MEKKEFLTSLKNLRLLNKLAILLRDEIVSTICTTGELPLRGTKINQTMLANMIGVSRQIFYPGRGSKEFTEILHLTESYVEELGRSDIRSTPKENRNLTQLKSAIITLTEENTELKNSLNELESVMELIHKGRIVII